EPKWTAECQAEMGGSVARADPPLPERKWHRERSRSRAPLLGPAVTNADVCRRIRKHRGLGNQAARRKVRRFHTSLSAATSASMSLSLCTGEGVRRSRSLPRGTVG